MSSGEPTNDTTVSTNGDQPAVQQDGDGQQQPQQRRTWWDTFRSILFQMVIFYFISSFFRGRQTPPTNPDGTVSVAGFNLFGKDDKLVRVGVYTPSGQSDIFEIRSQKYVCETN